MRIEVKTVQKMFQGECGKRMKHPEGKEGRKMVIGSHAVILISPWYKPSNAYHTIHSNRSRE